MNCYFVNWGKSRSNKRKEGSCKAVWDFLLTFPLSKPGSFRSLFGHNINILVEDKDKAEAR